jgi:dolichol-phosphate mannosyltransferase
MKRLCTVAISCLNEEDNIPFLYEALCQVVGSLEQFDWEFVFVDDGSTDSTWDLLTSLNTKDSRVKCIRLSRNYGAQEGTSASIYYAQGDAIVSMGADMQDPPELIVDFITKWEEGYDIVWGVRRTRDDHWLKQTTANLFYKLMDLAGGGEVPKNTGGFCLISRDVAEVFNSLQERHRVFFELIGWLGFSQTSVSYDRPARHAGQSKFTVSKLFKTAMDCFFSVSKLPIRAVTFVGLFFSTFSFLYLVYIFISRITGNIQTAGWASLLMTILLSGGIIMISIGVIGEYLWRILDEIKHRPVFVARKIVGDVRSGENFK